jgi:hypothetical protein
MVLEHDADDVEAKPPAGGLRRWAGAGDPDRAGRGPDLPVDQLEERRLASPAGPTRSQLAGMEAQVDVRQRLPGTV